MIGYIVGYCEEWGLDRNPLITGVFTEWSIAKEEAEKQEYINIDNYKGLRITYIVELDMNKTYSNKEGNTWIYNFKHYILKTDIKNNLILIDVYNNEEEDEEEIDEWIEVKKNVKVNQQKYKKFKN